MPKRASADYLRDGTRREVPTRDQAGLIEMIEERLLGQNGNLAWVSVRLIEFAEWQPLWGQLLGGASSDQLWHRLPAIDEVLGATTEVMQCGLHRIDAHEFIESGKHFAKVHGPLRCFAA